MQRDAHHRNDQPAFGYKRAHPNTDVGTTEDWSNYQHEASIPGSKIPHETCNRGEFHGKTSREGFVFRRGHFEEVHHAIYPPHFPSILRR